MHGKKAMVLLTTGGSGASFAGDSPDAYGALDSFLFHIHRGMFEFCGYKALAPVVTFEPVRLDDKARAMLLSLSPVASPQL